MSEDDVALKCGLEFQFWGGDFVIFLLSYLGCRFLDLSQYAGRSRMG